MYRPNVYFSQFVLVGLIKSTPRKEMTRHDVPLRPLSGRAVIPRRRLVIHHINEVNPVQKGQSVRNYATIALHAERTRKLVKSRAGGLTPYRSRFT